jgi:NAD(P)-dependent dehydrogenase (short-subunit alcohol dehydrogenase family)
MSESETVIIVGVGPGLGLALVETFAGAGMKVAMAARKTAHLDALLPDDRGGRIRTYPCDTTDPAAVEGLFEQATAELGAPDVAVYNAGAFRPGGILEIAPDDFESCWKVGCYGGFLVGQAAAKRMVPRGRGTILFTGATAALRGGAGFANLAVPKFGLRALSQSMARELGPQGLHVAHVVIDGIIDAERSRGLKESDAPDARLAPEAIAANYLMLHRQPRSAWTQELDLRPWVEKF